MAQILINIHELERSEMGNKASYYLSSSILSSDKPVMDYNTSFDKPNLIPFIAVSMVFLYWPISIPSSFPSSKITCSILFRYGLFTYQKTSHVKKFPSLEGRRSRGGDSRNAVLTNQVQSVVSNDKPSTPLRFIGEGCFKRGGSCYNRDRLKSKSVGVPQQ